MLLIYLQSSHSPPPLPLLVFLSLFWLLVYTRQRIFAFLRHSQLPDITNYNIHHTMKIDGRHRNMSLKRALWALLQSQSQSVQTPRPGDWAVMQ